MASKLQLSMALVANDRSQPIIDGSVAVEGVDLNLTVAKSGGEIFWRQLHFRDFDIAELSFSDALIATSQGDREFVMLPVFMTRRFFHTAIQVRADSGIEKPSDLRGKRVGVQEYVQTSHVWTRGILAEEFGVDANEIHWFQERSKEMGHLHFFGIEPPTANFCYIEPHKTVGGMMLSGELDAVLAYSGKPNMMDRSSANLAANPLIRPLFPKPRVEQIRYFEKTGFYPVNHAPVVRRSLVAKYPWLALNIYNAFVAAKQKSAATVKAMADAHASLGWLTADARSALDRDAFPYGIIHNRAMLETAARYSYEQGLSRRLVSLDELFAEQTLPF